MSQQLFNRHGAERTPNACIGGKEAYTYISKCSRCGGAGQSEAWRHTGLVCYDCGGSGNGPRREEKLYTAEQLAALNERAAKAAARRDAKRQAEAAALEAERAERREGFCAIYADALAQIDVCIESEQLRDGEPSFWAGLRRDLINRANPLSDRQLEVIAKGYERVMSARAARAAAHHVGEVGKRLRGVKAEVVRSLHICTVSRFPRIEKYLVVFKTEDGGELAWFTGHGEALGECVIDFTVKEHGEYQGKPQTVVQRVAFHEVAVEA